MDIDNITSIKHPIINKKKRTHTHLTLFFMLLTGIPHGIFRKHKGFFFISESFPFN